MTFTILGNSLKEKHFLIIVLTLSLVFLTLPIQNSYAVTSIDWILDTGAGFNVVTNMAITTGNLDGGDLVSVRVTDTDQTFHTNGVIDKITVRITSTLDSSGVNLVLTETGVNDGIFEGDNFVFLFGNHKFTLNDKMIVTIEGDPATDCNPGVIDVLESTLGGFNGAFVYSDTEVGNGNDGIAIDLTETGTDTCVFRQTVSFSTDASDEANAILQVSEGDIITVIDDATFDLTNAQIIPTVDGKGSIRGEVANPAATASYTGTATVTANLQLLDDGAGGRGGGGAVRPSLVVDSPSVPSGSTDKNPPPTIGISKTNQKVVDYGFFHNSDKYEITDKFWTPFDKVKINVGVPQFFGMKGTGANQITRVEFGLVPEVGMMHEAEVLIEAWIKPGSEKIVIKQDENIVDVNAISPELIVRDEDCFEGSGEKDCVFVGVSNIIFREKPFFEVVGLKISDSKGRASVVYLNDGFEIKGKSMNQPKTDIIDSGKKGVGLISVKQIDKWKNIWQGEDGIEYFKNNFGTYIRLTPVNMEQRQDESWTVMNRMNNNFEKIIDYEKMRAKELFDYDTIVSNLPESFAHEVPDYVDRFLDEDFVRYYNLQSELAKKYWDGSMIQSKLPDSFTYSYPEN